MTLPRAVVELECDGVALGLGEVSHRLPFGEVLTDQAVGVLVRAAFPGVVRVGEVDGHAGGALDDAEIVELGAVVGGDGLEQVGMAADQLDGPFGEHDHGAVDELADQNPAGDALDEADDAVLAAGTDYGVHLPVPDLPTQFHGRGPLSNVPFAGHASALLVRTVTLAALSALTEKAVELTALPLVAQNVLVDGLVADLQQIEFAQAAADLFGTEQLGEQPGDQAPVLRGELAVASGT